LSTIPPGCVDSTTRPCASTQPLKPAPSVGTSFQARTVSVSAETNRIDVESNLALSTSVKRLSAAKRSVRSFAAIVAGSKLAIVTVFPTSGSRTSTATAGIIVGSRIGPRTARRCVSAGCPGTFITNATPVSPSARPTMLIGATALSIDTSKVCSTSDRDSVITLRALARNS
jgi:hypothetical protein